MNSVETTDFPLSESPYAEFNQWLSDAQAFCANDPTWIPEAMTLVTLSPENHPYGRIVLFKGLLEDGISFYTNYNSPKSKQLLSSSKSSAVFYWHQLGKQVRIEGVTHSLSREQSETYFKTRPRASQIGAWASPQSERIESRQFLEDRVTRFEKEFEGKDVPCPPHWGGFLLVPLRFEFWINQTARLHDRYEYVRENTKTTQWQHYRLAP